MRLALGDREQGLGKRRRHDWRRIAQQGREFPETRAEPRTRAPILLGTRSQIARSCMQQGYVEPRIPLAGQGAWRAGVLPGQGLHICGAWQLVRRGWPCEAWRRLTGRHWRHCSRELLGRISPRRRERGCGAEGVRKDFGSVRVRLVVAQRGRAGAGWQ